MGPLVGIDLGTTNSAIGLLDGKRVRFLPNALGDVLTPSVVAQDPKTKMLVVGRTAKDLIATHPELGASRFKTEMGRLNTRQVGERQLSIVELSAYVLDALRADAERELKTAVTRCVVTVPAYFDDAQRHATRQAAEQAGFAVERILNEPTAAAIAYGLHKRDDEALFAVLDLGGGTFDVCVMELFEGVLQVKSVAGENRLGGEDFTEALAALIAERAGFPRPPPTTPAGALLFKRAELAKRALACADRVDVSLTAEVAGRDVALVITAAEAARVWEPLVRRLQGPIEHALRHANVAPAKLTEVVLVGGATRLPCIRRAVATLLRREPVQHDDPDLLVAEGAAIQAGAIAGASVLDDRVITDVASHSLGIGSPRRVGARVVGGYFVPIIFRNTVIPTSQWEVQPTIEDDQTTMTIGIYEGEGRRVDDNRKLGELVVSDIPRGPAGSQTINVRFTYDHNGMLEVEANVMTTNKTVRTMLRRTGGEVTGDALVAARARIAALRADPADRPRYRDVLARARLLRTEADTATRGRIDALVDRFDDASDALARADVEATYVALLSLCEELDRGERW